MAREFICHHCFTTYTGTLPFGATTTCHRCNKDFVVLRYLGEKGDECWKRRGGFLGLATDFLFSKGDSLVGFKLICPVCDRDDSCEKLGEIEHQQRVVNQLWHNCWTSFFFCRTCRVTWSAYGSSVA